MRAVATGLFSVHGTAGGVQELLGSLQGSFALQPSALTTAGGEAFFSAYNSSGKQGLWVTNGTSAGTRQILVNSGATPLAPSDIVAVGDDVIFEAQDQNRALSLYWSNARQFRHARNRRGPIQRQCRVAGVLIATR